jgi:hypothetical protein
MQTTTGVIEFTWEEPIKDGGASISHYRLFIQDNKNEYQSMVIDTPDAAAFYRWYVPKPMWGRYFTVTV